MMPPEFREQAGNQEEAIHHAFGQFVEEIWENPEQWGSVSYADPRILAELIVRATELLDYAPFVDSDVKGELIEHIKIWMEESQPQGFDVRLASSIVERLSRAAEPHPPRTFRTDTDRETFLEKKDIATNIAWAYILYRSPEVSIEALDRAGAGNEGVDERMIKFSLPVVELATIAAAVRAQQNGNTRQIEDVRHARTVGAAIRRAREIMRQTAK